MKNQSEIGTGLAVGATLGFLAIFLDLPIVVSFWGDRAYFIPTAALLGAVAWRTRLRALFAVVAIGLGVFWTVAAFTPLTYWLAQHLPRRDPLVRADAVYVLGSRIQDDGGLTTPALSRLVHGLSLLAEGWAPRLVLPELAAPSARYEPAARELMRSFGLEQEILIVGPVRNTYDEARAVAQLARERGFTRVLVVTSPTHSRRASAALEHEGVTVVSSPSDETMFDLESLDSPDDRLRALGVLLHERVGLWVYRLRGWI